MYSIWNTFDQIFKDFEKTFYTVETTTYDLVSKYYPNFPPVDIYIKEDKTLVFEFAVAGYPEEKIELKHHDDHLTLNLESYPVDESTKYLKKGIKGSKIESSYAVPSDKYDTTKLKATLKDGILKVEIPARAKEEIKSKKIEITKED